MLLLKGINPDSCAGENLEKFWDTGGGNRALQNPSMAAATASIFGSHVGLSQSTSGSKQEPGRSTATDIAKLFPRATSLATSGFEAVPMRKPKAMDVNASGMSPHPLPLPSTSNTVHEKAGGASAATPFDGAFGAPDLQLSAGLAGFDASGLQPDRGHEGDGLFNSIFMNSQDDAKPSQPQPPPAPDGAAAKGFSAFHTLVNSGSTDPQQQKLAQAPPLFTGMPGGPRSSLATLQAGSGAGGGVSTGDRGTARACPDTLQGIAQQVAAVGLGGSGSGAGGMWGGSGSTQAPQGAARPKQQPVETPFGGPPGAGMGWAAGLSSGSLTLGESFDPLMALELLDSRAAAERNPGMLESQGMTMDMFSSFAPSLDMAAATAQAPAASAGELSL